MQIFYDHESGFDLRSEALELCFNRAGATTCLLNLATGGGKIDEAEGAAGRNHGMRIVSKLSALEHCFVGETHTELIREAIH